MALLQSPSIVVQSARAGGAPANVLRAEIASLQRSLVSIRAQRAELQRQMDGLPPNSPLRGTLQLHAMQLDEQAVQSQMQIAGDEAQLASRQTPVVVVRPPQSNGLPPELSWMDPDVLSGLFVFVVVAIILPISVGITRRLWRRPPAKDAPSQVLDTVMPRLDRLDQAVDAIAIEVERISEGQRFVSKALAERPKPVNAGSSVDPAGLGEAKPFLALGAGGVEPIRVPERQAVKQSVTPH